MLENIVFCTLAVVVPSYVVMEEQRPDLSCDIDSDLPTHQQSSQEILSPDSRDIALLWQSDLLQSFSPPKEPPDGCNQSSLMDMSCLVIPPAKPKPEPPVPCDKHKVDDSKKSNCYVSPFEKINPPKKKPTLFQVASQSKLKTELSDVQSRILADILGKHQVKIRMLLRHVGDFQIEMHIPLDQIRKEPF